MFARPARPEAGEATQGHHDTSVRKRSDAVFQSSASSSSTSVPVESIPVLLETCCHVREKHYKHARCVYCFKSPSPTDPVVGRPKGRYVEGMGLARFDTASVTTFEKRKVQWANIQVYPPKAAARPNHL